MIEVENVQEQDVENVQEQVDQDFMIFGESSKPFDAINVLRRVAVIQRKRKTREVLLLEWKTNQFVLVGDASSVPYSAKEIARQMKKKKMKMIMMMIKKDDKPDDNDDKDDKGDDDNDQGASGLLIRNPIVQEKVEELMNDKINEQEDDLQNEASSSGK
ncbi:hypothetical protein Hanom_Chr04g00325541 [Helianthus anomalus]